jgi:hypothetical protein
MKIKKRTIRVTQWIEVSYDDDKFTEEFMKEFQEVFYPFDSVDEHIKHIAQMFARGVISNHGFVEGYGDIRNFGVKCTVEDYEIIQDEE